MEEQDRIKNEGMRTFYRDLQSLETDYQQTGILKSVVQEQQTARERTRQVRKRRIASVVWAIVGIILVGGGLGAVIIAEQRSSPPALTQNTRIPSLFAVDYSLKLPLDENASTTLAGFAQQSYASPNIVRVVPEHGTLASLQETGQVLWPNLPRQLIQATTPQFVLGFHATQGKQYPFLVLGITDLPQARAGLSAWEETLAQDLLIAFSLDPTLVSRGTFQDEIINNLPARSLYATTLVNDTETIQIPIIGSTDTEPSFTEETINITSPSGEERVLFYTILNATYIVITTHPDTVNEIVGRTAQI